MIFKNKNIYDAFQCSINGLKILFKENSARFELLLIIYTCAHIYIFRPESHYTILLIIFPILILSLEALNTAIEFLCNKITEEKCSQIKKIKDLGSASIFLILMAYIIVLIMSFYK